MQENSMDQPTSLSQLLRESYLAEGRAHHRHGEPSCIDSPRRLVYGTLKEKADDSGGKMDPQFSDLSAFLSQEELDKSVDLACKAFSSDPREREERSDAPPSVSHSNFPSNKPTPEAEVISERHTVQTPIQDSAIRNARRAREPAADFKRPQRNAPYGLETQSKKEFLNKAADFIEELSSLFKASSSKRIRPRTCKTHRSRCQDKTQPDGTSFSINAEDRERAILLNQQMEEPMENSGDTEEPYEAEEHQSPEPVCEEPALIQPESSEEPMWFCEGKELENSPDIQIIANGERHSLIITEAFEEDTGRYSCFASNFYGTDSTSAEIYIEGASSSDSDVEQHFQAQLHKRSAQPNPAVVLVEPSTCTSAEDTIPTITNTCAEPPALSDAEEVPLTELIADSTSKQEDTELLSSKVVSSEIPVLEPTVPLLEPPTPISEVESTPPIPSLPIAPPSPPSSQSVSDILLTPHQSNPENLNGSSSYLQNFDVRPIMAAPVFTKNLQDILAVESQLVVLECRVKGIPSPKVDWYREGTLIEDSPDFRVLQKRNHNESRSSSRVGLRVTFKLPEDEEEEGMSSKEPPPVLAKPKLDPVQLQILHNQVLLEQQQENVSPSQDSPHLDGTSCMVPSTLLTQTNVVPTLLQLNIGPVSPNVAPVTPMPSVIPTIPITQPGGAPNIPIPPNVGPSAPFPQLIMAPTAQPPNHVVNMPPITPSTHISQINMNPTRTQALMIPDALALNNTAPKINTTSNSHPSLAPQDTYSQAVSYPSLSKITSPHLVRNQPSPIPSPMSPPPVHGTQPPLPGIIPVSTQSFSYTRPKEFITAQMISPIRSPSPTESPVPMLHELAAQIFPKSTRELMSPVNQLSPSPRKFPTRVLECPSSPPYVSSPPLLPPGMMYLYPILMAYLSLYSMFRPQGALKKNQRGSRLMSDDDIRGSKEALLQDIEKKLRFKDEQLHFGQQEYKVSSFEQRLLSEIEFRLERTPVEESDDEVQHDEIPSGRCIAPIFDKKLKHFRAVEGIPVTFTCKVVGIPVPKVYWFKDGKQILKRNEHYKKIREGDGTCSLHIEAVTSDDDGNYTVMAANPQVSGLPHPEIMWLLNGKPIYPDLTHRMLVRENGIHSLVIDPLTQADDGTYTCIASNKAGQSSFGLQLKVVEKELKQAPHFVEKLQNTGIAEGAPVRLECRVVGMPQPLIYWKKDNDTIPHSVDRVSMHQDTTGYVCLLIQPTRKEDAGWYTVSAKNEAGIISCTARLDIYAQWYQHVHPPMKKAQLSGSRYAALTGQGLDIKSTFPMSDNGLVMFSASQPERTAESEEL
ncbi:hypothetical protein cypCar_00036004 [Cyprinus carpio]|nr:hypothetical protein cypCar_00036004 [Cyprinus carpio]